MAGLRSRPGTEGFGKTLVVVVCGVAVEEDVRDDVCVDVRRALEVVGGGRTIGVGCDAFANARCESYTIPSAIARMFIKRTRILLNRRSKHVFAQFHRR